MVNVHVADSVLPHVTTSAEETASTYSCDPCVCCWNHARERSGAFRNQLPSLDVLAAAHARSSSHMRERNVAQQYISGPRGFMYVCNEELESLSGALRISNCSSTAASCIRNAEPLPVAAHLYPSKLHCISELVPCKGRCFVP